MRLCLQPSRNGWRPRRLKGKRPSYRPCGTNTGPLSRAGYPKGPFMGLRGKPKRDLMEKAQ